jgi:hypothetical protein
MMAALRRAREVSGSGTGSASDSDGGAGFEGSIKIRVVGYPVTQEGVAAWEAGTQREHIRMELLPFLQEACQSTFDIAGAERLHNTMMGLYPAPLVTSLANSAADVDFTCTLATAKLLMEVGRKALWAMNADSGSELWLKVMVSYMMSLILAVATGSFRALFRNEVAEAKARGRGKGRAVGRHARSRGAQRGANAVQATTVGYAVRGRKRAGQAKTGVADRSYKHNIRGCLKGRALARRAGGRRVGAVKWRRAAAGALFRPIGGPAPASESVVNARVLERERESARRWARGWVGALGWKGGGARKREAAPCQTGGMEEPDWEARRWCRVPLLPRRTEEAMGQARGPGVGT